MSDILYLDPIGGIAGDMFLAACIDLGVAPEALRQGLAGLGALGFDLIIERDHTASIAGVRIRVDLSEKQPPERSYPDVRRLIETSSLSARVKEAALEVFRVIGEAEASVHHKALEDIHFHEVGAIDSIVDVCGAALCLELLGWPRVLASPPPAGSGTARTMHGIIPIPAPATLEILRGRRMRASGPGERTTPTGAGLLAALTGEVETMPDLAVDRVGYGLGTKSWEDAPNVLRAVLGREARHHAAHGCLLLEANLDDATGPILARALEMCLESGALDAWITPIIGKKGRPAHLLSVLVEPLAADRLRTVLVAETTTLGVRTLPCERMVLDREWHEVTTPWGSVRVKIGRHQGRVVNVAPENDDCLALARAHSVPLKQVLQAAAAAAENLARR